MQALDQLNEEKKKQALLDLEEQNQQEAEARKDAVYKKFMGGFEQEDLAAEMKRVLHDNHADSALQHLEQDKAQQEQKLKERLAKRTKQMEQVFKEQAANQTRKVREEDVIGLYEQEIVSTEAHLRLKKQAPKTDGGCVGIDKQGNPITDIKQATAADIARKEADERKEAINEARFRLCQEIDSALNQKQLLMELEKSDA